MMVRKTRPGYGAWWAVSLCAALTSGCALHGDRTERAVELPSAWRHAQAGDTASPINAQWWRSFGSTELDALIARAQSQSNDLAAAVARALVAQDAAPMKDVPDPETQALVGRLLGSEPPGSV